MRELGWGLIAVGALFGLVTLRTRHTGLLIDRGIRIARAKDPKGFRGGVRFLAGYAIGCAMLGVVVLELS